MNFTYHLSVAIKDLQTVKGIALSDILQDLLGYFIRIKGIDPKSRSYLLDQLANVEYRLSLGTSEDIQLSALVGICQIVRDSSVANKV